MLSRSLLSTFIILLLGAGIVYALWYWRPQVERRPLPKAATPLVEVISARPQDYQSRVITQGSVAPKHQVNIVAQVAGQVLSTSDKFAAGAGFEADEVLVKLDARDYQFARVAAQSRVASARRELALEKGQARQAKRVWRDLGSKEANALSLREPQVAAAQAALTAAQAELQQAELNLLRTVISVPFQGRVLTASVSKGQFVPAGAVLGSVFDSAVAEVRLPLSDEQLSLLGLTAGVDIKEQSVPRVTLRARIGDNTVQWPAQLVRAESQLDTRTRLLHLIAEVPEPLSKERYQQPLPMGLFVEAELQGRLIDNALAIPRKALHNRALWRVNDEQLLELVPVNIIAEEEALLWVSGDINENDKLVVSDPRVLRAGLRVDIKAARGE